MLGLTTKSKLEEQEARFEEKLAQVQAEYQGEIDLLKIDNQFKTKALKLANEEIIMLNQINAGSLANEEILNKQCKFLSDELKKAKSISFPSKKFNVDKAVQMVTKELSAKTLATFLYRLVEELGESHIDSLIKYLNKKKTKISEKVD